MGILDFIIFTIFISASGALSPGPLFFGAVLNGAKAGAKGGLMISMGHMIIELPLVLILAAGLTSLTTLPIVKLVTGLAGGASLIIFGALQTYGVIKIRSREVDHKDAVISSRKLVAIGMILTGLNPFFMIWWLTVGIKLVVDAVAFAALAGIFLMYSAHVWMDYAFLGFVAHASKKGANLVGSTGYRLFTAVLGVVFVAYGAYFISSAL
ncbi:MAG: LysE family transporter [Thaumarchaeota archaeon]|nr:LysE family transporter [Nitrososphaerota archaeon]